MAALNPCLYCGASASSDEHVISEALGCRELIKDGVCPVCNNSFGHSFEGKFVNGLALFLNFFKIPNGQGVVPSVQLKGKIGSEEFKFVMTGDGKAVIPPGRYETKEPPQVTKRNSEYFTRRKRGK